MTEPLGVTVRDFDGKTTTHPEADSIHVDAGHLHLGGAANPVHDTVAIYAPGQWVSATRNTG